MKFHVVTLPVEMLVLAQGAGGEVGDAAKPAQAASTA